MTEATKKYAIVTGANKGIGLGVVKQLASNGFTMVLTARDEKRDLEAVEKPKDYAGVAAAQLGSALVNNAGILGAMVDAGYFKGAKEGKANCNKTMTQTYELAEECLQTDYYGAKRTAEALIPLLQLSNSPRIVNISSSMGKISLIPIDWAKEVFSDAKSLTEERIDEVLESSGKTLRRAHLKAKDGLVFTLPIQFQKRQ
ncbi:hypothetical protein ACFX13_041525 [Malus domestica]